MKILLFLFFAFIALTQAYVSKVRQNNHSDIGNIRKVIPTDLEYSRRKNRPKSMEEQLKDLESLVLAINTGRKESIKPSVARAIQEFVSNVIENENVKAFFRSNKRSYDLKPEIVHFKSDKPSLMLEVNFETIISALDELLTSKKVKEYADNLGHNAAIIYRTLEETRKDGKVSKNS